MKNGTDTYRDKMDQVIESGIIKTEKVCSLLFCNQTGSDRAYQICKH